MQMNECLQEIFKNKGLTQNGVSKITGINKGTLNRLLNGKQNVKFDEILTFCNNIGLTSGERDLIFNTYFRGIYGDYYIDAATFAIEEFSKADDRAADSVPSRGFSVYPDSGFMSDFQKMEEAIYSVTDIDSGRIYTNFPFSNKRLDDFFYDKAKKGNIELVHFVEKIQNGGETENLYTLIRSLRYMNILQFPYVINIWNSGNETQLLPYFVMTEKGAVLFDRTSGFITVSDRSIAHLMDTVQKMAAASIRFGKKTADIMEVKNIIAGAVSHKTEIISFCKYPCFASYVTREMMYEAANDVPNKDQLIEICAAHYEILLTNAQKTQFTTLDGLEDFALTGNFYEIPGDFVHEFSPKTRVKLLEAIKNEIKNDRLYILNKTNALPEGIAIESYTESTVITGTDTTQKNFGLAMKFRYKANDPFYFKITRIIKEYLIAAQYVFSVEASLRFVDNCITIAKTMEK